MSLLAAMFVLSAGLPAGSLPDEGWAEWQIPSVRIVERMGCGEDGETDLARHPHGWNFLRGGDVRPEPPQHFDTVRILVRRKAGHPVELRLLTPDCRVTGADVLLIDGMNAQDSLEWLSGGLETEHDRELIEAMIAAVAFHPQGRATKILAGQVERVEERRWQPAIFWLAQLRGEVGESIVVEYLAQHPGEKHRRHAAVVLALTERDSALVHVRRAAQEDESEEVRGHALFALTLADAPGTVAFIDTVLTRESAADVREQGIFALAQVDNAAAVEVMKRIMRDPSFGEHRRTALFWLAQMSHPGAADIVANIAASL